jgi:hypothetical protein
MSEHMANLTQRPHTDSVPGVPREGQARVTCTCGWATGWSSGEEVNRQLEAHRDDVTVRPDEEPTT